MAGTLLSRTFGIAAVIALSLVLLYLTRFWVFADWWGNEGLFGFKDLTRQGDLLTRQLRGTPYQPFALLFWLAGGFLLLSILHAVASRIGSLFTKH
jgi:hypothetical protein